MVCAVFTRNHDDARLLAASAQMLAAINDAISLLSKADGAKWDPLLIQAVGILKRAAKQALSDE